MRPLPRSAVRRCLLLLTAGGLMVGGPLATTAGAAEPQVMERAEPTGTGSATDELVVRYRAGTTAAERRSIKSAHGVTRVSISADRRTEVVVVDGGSVAVARQGLEDERDVVAVGRNYRRSFAVDPTTEPFWGLEWGLHNTGQTIDGFTEEAGTVDVDIDGLQALQLGAGDPDVVVAVIDDGVDIDHTDLDDSIWTNPGESGGGRETNGDDDDGNGYIDDVHGWDFCNDDNTVHDGDVDFHATHVAGTIAAELNGSGVVGVAPGVTIMPLKFIESGDCGFDSQAIRAIDYAASFGVRIINASWGGPFANDALDAAIGDSGALFVAAAGNSGQNMDDGGRKFYPAASTLSNILSVAASNQDGALAGFSNRGNKSVDIAAPGTNILSTFSQGCPTPCYAWAEGTSMAAPHVAGVAALALSHATSSVSTAALKSRILARGQTLSRTSGLTLTGDMVNAYNSMDGTPPVARRPDQYSVNHGSQIGSTSGPAIIRWPAATDNLVGIHHYSLKKRGGTTWATIDDSTTALSAKTTITFGRTYLFRVRAYDKVGNNDAADSATVKAMLFSEKTSLASYGSGWSAASSGGALGGALRSTTRAGAEMTFAFNGRSVSLIAPRSSSRGSFTVYVDGVLAGTVNLHASSARSRVAVFTKAWSTSGSHTLRIVNDATPGHPRIDVDGFVVFRDA